MLVRPIHFVRSIARSLRTSRTPSSSMRSLQATLTLRMATILVLGLTTVTIWTYWKTQNILITSHKQSLAETANRIENDVTLYREMFSAPESLQKAINNRAGESLWIGVKQTNQVWLIAEPLQNQSFLNLSQSQFQSWIERLSKQRMPTVYRLQNQHVVACASPLATGSNQLGTLYLVHDITAEQQQFYQLIRSLIGANSIALLLMLGVIIYESRRLMRPLQQVSRATKAISVENLGGETLSPIPNAPHEVQELVRSFNRVLARLSDAWQQQQLTSQKQQQFVSNVSHELRTPLSIVRGYLESVLRRNHTLSESQEEALCIAATETDHTIRILQNLLDLARADDGQMHYHLELMILNDVVNDVVQIASQINPRHIQIIDSELVPVYADACRLKQVLVNLVDNAVKYADPHAPVEIKLEQEQERALIHVCDQGPGIDLKHQSRIFERFYRVDEARTRSSGGTGLGLSLVETFVSGMGGQVSVRSTLGKGSIFTVSLPTTPPGGEKIR